MGKIKEIKRTANVSWSPREAPSIYLAAGTVAQQLDATFNTNANLEIFKLDLSNSSSLDLPLVGSVESKQRFHKVVWSGHQLSSGDTVGGVIVGGSDNGVITLWDAGKVATSVEDGALTIQTDQHSGAVRTLDVNPFQSNLLASGAGDSEIYIWDLNNPTVPMSPGNKLHPLEDVSCVSWNRQVQHILGSSSPSGRSVVWDLRKNEPIIQISDSSSKIRCKSLAWHPNIATQMVTGSEDDRCPVIQLWDLRFATSPVRNMEGHQKGVLSLAWCPQDADLLLSAAKDNKVLCWNPNVDVPGGQVVYKLPATTRWIFECEWCPRNPAVISTSSFDGHVSMYSILGGGVKGGANADAPKVDIDPSDPFSAIAASAHQNIEETAPLKTPPKWLRRPCAANFGFGGKLVSVNSTRRSVSLVQVITQPKLIEQSKKFEDAISQKSLSEYCSERLESCTSEVNENVWKFIKANFDSEPRKQYLKLLGQSPEVINAQFAQWQESLATPAKEDAPLANGLEESVATLEISDGEENEDDTEDEKRTTQLFSTDTTSDFDTIPTDTVSTADTDTNDLVIPSGQDGDGLLTRCLLTGDFATAVDICVKTNRMPEALIISVAGGPKLLHSTQQLYVQQNVNPVTKVISLVTNRKWSELAEKGDLDNWREILSSLVTYAKTEEFSSLCDVLGERLEVAGNHDNAALCYICSGNIEKFVNCWLKSSDGNVNDPLILHDLIEKVILLKNAVETGRNTSLSISSDVIVDRFSTYASVLASQGNLTTALVYLQQIDGKINDRILLDRVSKSLGYGHKPVSTTPKPVTTTPTVMSPNVTPSYQPVSSAVSGYSRNNPYQKITTTPMVTPISSTRPPISMATQPHPPISMAPQPYPPVSMATQPHPPVSTAPQQLPPISIPSQPPVYGAYPSPGSSSPKTKQAWNDPPMLRATTGKKKATATIAPTPLTVPLASTDPVGGPPTPPTTVPTNNPPTPTTPQQQYTPDAPPVKQPIPSEHVVLQTVFDTLLSQCRARANNMASRKKVDDISKKLEILYDLLRESSISGPILQGLHLIVQDIQSMNYAGGLARLNHMVSTSSMSEVSSFLPGIKTLLQLAARG